MATEYMPRPKTPESNDNVGDKKPMRMTNKAVETSYQKTMGGKSEAELKKGYCELGKMSGTGSDKGYA